MATKKPFPWKTFLPWVPVFLWIGAAALFQNSWEVPETASLPFNFFKYYGVLFAFYAAKHYSISIWVMGIISVLMLGVGLIGAISGREDIKAMKGIGNIIAMIFVMFMGSYFVDPNGTPGNVIDRTQESLESNLSDENVRGMYKPITVPHNETLAKPIEDATGKDLSDPRNRQIPGSGRWFVPLLWFIVFLIVGLKSGFLQWLGGTFGIILLILGFFFWAIDFWWGYVSVAGVFALWMLYWFFKGAKDAGVSAPSLDADDAKGIGKALLVVITLAAPLLVHVYSEYSLEDCYKWGAIIGGTLFAVWLLFLRKKE
ncbi:MAG: hypothetical protein P8P30_11085 [Rickettsiales bacterium]|nr:hypothetical protein [Rickettsiales bacterium]